MELTQHPLSAAFPSMSADDFAALVQDVKANGQREPIMLLDGMVLDGWHRYRACTEAGIKPQTFTFPQDKDPVAFVLSHNLHRRHLTPSQRAAAVVACTEWAPAHRPKKAETISAFSTTDKMAKAAGTSDRTIRDAKAAHKAGLGEAVKEGAMTAHEAAKVARGGEPKKTTLPPAPAPERGQTLPPPAEAPAPSDDFDPVAELERAHAEIQKLTAEIQAAEADDLKKEAIKWRRAYEHAERQQSEAMDRAKQATDREAWTMKQLRRCGKAVGVDDPKKIAAAVEAMASERAAA